MAPIHDGKQAKVSSGGVWSVTRYLKCKKTCGQTVDNCTRTRSTTLSDGGREEMNEGPPPDIARGALFLAALAPGHRQADG